MVPPFDSDSDEREKPSWREIDRRRDRSRHVSRDDRSKKEKSLVPPFHLGQGTIPEGSGQVVHRKKRSQEKKEAKSTRQL